MAGLGEAQKSTLLRLLGDRRQELIADELTMLEEKGERYKAAQFERAKEVVVGRIISQKGSGTLSEILMTEASSPTQGQDLSKAS